MESATRKQKVFGIGVSRTGTSSLAAALRILGWRTAHYPLQVVSRHNGSLLLNTTAVEQYDAITDMPAARFYKELDAAFPQSKFILTVRDTKSWVASMRRLKFSYRFLRYIPTVRELVADVFGTDSYNDEQTLCAAYNAHAHNVRTYFHERPSDLLVLDLKAENKWEQLCDFLDCTPPAQTFPHHNARYSTTVRNVIDFIGAGTSSN